MVLLLVVWIGDADGRVRGCCVACALFCGCVGLSSIIITSKASSKNKLQKRERVKNRVLNSLRERARARARAARPGPHLELDLVRV